MSLSLQNGKCMPKLTECPEGLFTCGFDFREKSMQMLHPVVSSVKVFVTLVVQFLATDAVAVSKVTVMHASVLAPFVPWSFGSRLHVQQFAQHLLQS